MKKIKRKKAHTASYCYKISWSQNGPQTVIRTRVVVFCLSFFSPLPFKSNDLFPNQNLRRVEVLSTTRTKCTAENTIRYIWFQNRNHLPQTSFGLGRWPNLNKTISATLPGQVDGYFPRPKAGSIKHLVSPFLTYCEVSCCMSAEQI